MVAQHCWFGMKLFQTGKFSPNSLLQMLQDCKGLCLVPKPTFLDWAGPVGMNILGDVVVKEIILNLCSDQAKMPYLLLLFRSTGRCSKACSFQKPNFLQTWGSSQHHKVSFRSGACASSSSTQSSNSKEASAPAKDRSQGGKCKRVAAKCTQPPLHSVNDGGWKQCEWLVVFCRKSCQVSRCWNNFVYYSHKGIKIQERLEGEPYAYFLFVSPFSCCSSSLSKPCQDLRLICSLSQSLILTTSGLLCKDLRQLLNQFCVVCPFLLFLHTL